MKKNVVIWSFGEYSNSVIITISAPQYLTVSDKVMLPGYTR